MKQMYFLKKIGCLLGLMVLAVPIIAQEPVQYNSAEAEPQKSIYCQEFEGLKSQPPYSVIFSDDSDDANSNQALMETKRTYNEQEKEKYLTPFQKIMRPELSAKNLVVIPPTAMPSLYAYINGICKQHGMSMPFIGVILHRQVEPRIYYYAAASKNAMGPGIIIINPEFFKYSHKAFEAAIAHELGHIKYNHENKQFFISVLSLVAAGQIANLYLVSPSDSSTSKFIKIIAALGCCALIDTKWLIPLIARQFEKQADEFAYKDCDKAEGLIEFLSPHAESERKLRDLQLRIDEHFKEVYQEEQRKLPLVSRIKNMTLGLMQYSIETIDYSLFWLLEKKPSRHPSPEDRVKAVREYLAMQQDKIVIDEDL